MNVPQTFFLQIAKNWLIFRKNSATPAKNRLKLTASKGKKGGKTPQYWFLQLLKQAC